MAIRRTYLYRIELGHKGKIETTEFCYARNAHAAKEYYKEKYRDKRYDFFNAVVFGTADIAKHPGQFEELPSDEVDWLKAHNIGFAERYSLRYDNKGVPADAQFVPVDKLEEVL